MGYTNIVVFCQSLLESKFFKLCLHILSPKLMHFENEIIKTSYQIPQKSAEVK